MIFNERKNAGWVDQFAARTKLAALLICATMSSTAIAQQAVNDKLILLAAGSLQTAMKEAGELFQKETGVSVAASFGPSGNLRGEIETGRQFDVFASAAAEHTEALHAKKLLSESLVFAYNDLCVVSRPELGLMEANLLDTLKKPTVRLATSTPVSDPMGDYTWQFFRKADQFSVGSYSALDGKALKLSGARSLATGEKPPYVSAFDDDKADAYVMYCTNAASTKKALPSLTVVRIPDALNVRSAYGIGANPSSQSGRRFIEFMQRGPAKEILRKYGFS